MFTYLLYLSSSAFSVSYAAWDVCPEEGFFKNMSAFEDCAIEFVEAVFDVNGTMEAIEELFYEIVESPWRNIDSALITKICRYTLL